ncbi:MAG: pilus assembly protein PilM [Phycisphaerales bacterium]|nr:pilus assembly protein PilM [Phycisphaerales bacterium]
MLGARALTPIGLDIGRHAIKAVQCVGSPRSPRVVASLTLPRTAATPGLALDEAARLGDVLWRHGFQGRAAVVGVPESMLLASTIEIPPPSAGAPLAQIAASELARLHGVDQEGLETDFWVLPPTGPKGQRHEAIVVGVRSAEVQTLLEPLQSADGTGLTVRAVDVGPCARARASLLARPADAAYGVLDLGWTASRLSVIHEGQLVYDRTLPDAGLAHLERRLEQECALRPDDIQAVLRAGSDGPARRISGSWAAAVATHATACATEVAESLRYLALHRGVDRPRTVLLTGGGGECVPFVASLTEELAGATPLSLAAGFPGRSRTESDGASDPPRSSLAGALGLSLWGSNAAARSGSNSARRAA